MEHKVVTLSMFIPSLGITHTHQTHFPLPPNIPSHCRDSKHSHILSSIRPTTPPILTIFPRDPKAVALAYTPDSIWRNRSSFIRGHDEIITLLTQKWEREINYRLRKEVFLWQDNKIAVQFWYEVSAHHLPCLCFVALHPFHN